MTKPKSISKKSTDVGKPKPASQEVIRNVMLNKGTKCMRCGYSNSLKAEYINAMGLSSQIKVKCTNRQCDFKNTFWSSEKFEEKMHEINMRYTLAINTTGIGREAAKLLFTILNLPFPIHDLSNYNKDLLIVIGYQAKESMLRALNKALEEDGDDLVIGFDGSWQTRGH